MVKSITTKIVVPRSFDLLAGACKPWSNSSVAIQLAVRGRIDFCYGAFVVVHDTIEDRAFHDGIEEVVTATVSRLLGGLYVREDVKLFIEVRGAGNRTSTSDLVFHVGTTISSISIYLLGFGSRIPEAVAESIGWVHLWNDVTHGISGV
jgi:hypothetical protein